MAQVPGGDSHRCDECGIDFARSADAFDHRMGNHYEKPSPSIRKAIDRIMHEDRALLEKLGEH